MTLDQLRYFLAAARFEHIGKAAQSVSISPSAISTAIAALEDELGCELFRREGKSIVLNVSGPGTVVLHPDGSASEDLRGNDVVLLFPGATPAGPATYLFTGHTILSFDPAGNETLVSTTDNSPLDVCAALS